MSQVGDCSRTQPEGPIFNNFYAEESATPVPGLFHFTLDTYIIMMSVKLGGIKYLFFFFFFFFFFFSVWYDSTWDWTSVSRTIGEYTTH